MMKLIESESAMQEWLHGKFENESTLSKLIVDYDEFKYADLSTSDSLS